MFLSNHHKVGLRIPDDGKAYHLPPGLGQFPMSHVDDYSENVPESWIKHGGVMLPMYQSEALWAYFNSNYVSGHDTEYPFAIQVATGKINAVNGKEWNEKLIKKNQNYMVAPEQPWLDGYCVEEGLIRQFVAMPLGSGYSAEEQVSGKAEYGGMQIIAYPMKREVFERRFPKRDHRRYMEVDACFSAAPCAPMEMGLAPGGLMKQEIYKDPYKKSDCNLGAHSRCFVHIANSLIWRSVTGQEPPTVPFTASEYTSAGLPWFEHYDYTVTVVAGSKKLKRMMSIHQMAKKKGVSPLPENDSVESVNIIQLGKRLRKNLVREGAF